MPVRDWRRWRRRCSSRICRSMDRKQNPSLPSRKKPAFRNEIESAWVAIYDPVACSAIPSMFSDLRRVRTFIEPESNCELLLGFFHAQNRDETLGLIGSNLTPAQWILGGICSRSPPLLHSAMRSASLAGEGRAMATWIRGDSLAPLLLTVGSFTLQTVFPHGDRMLYQPCHGPPRRFRFRRQPSFRFGITSPEDLNLFLVLTHFVRLLP